MTAGLHRLGKNEALRSIIALWLLLGLAGCVERSAPEPQPTIIQAVKIITVATAGPQSWRTFPAEVEAHAASTLAFRVSGQIIDFPVTAGVRVKKGQLLARLDPTDFALRLDDREARFALAKSQFERAESLLGRQLTAQSHYDETKANLGVAQAALNIARAELEYTYLRAPYSGTVARVLAKNYEHIPAQRGILELQSRQRIDISIQVPENIVSRVRTITDYQPTVMFDSHPGQTFPVTLKEWDTRADPATLTYKVVFSLPVPDSFTVLPGMSASIKIDLARIIDLDASPLLLPASAVFSAEDTPLADKRRYVWKVDPVSMRVTRSPVTAGRIRGAGIEILSGLRPGDQVVAAGVHALSEGVQVRSWRREQGL